MFKRRKILWHFSSFVSSILSCTCCWGHRVAYYVFSDAWCVSHENEIVKLRILLHIYSPLYTARRQKVEELRQSRSAFVHVCLTDSPGSWTRRALQTSAWVSLIFSSQVDIWHMWIEQLPCSSCRVRFFPHLGLDNSAKETKKKWEW